MSTFAVIAILLLVVCSAAAFVAATSRHEKGARGALDLIGRVGSVEKDLQPEGAVLVGGELWPARSRSGRSIFRADSARVRVTGVRGHCLEVEPEA